MPAGESCRIRESFSSGPAAWKVFGSMYSRPALSTLARASGKLKVWNVHSAAPSFQSLVTFSGEGAVSTALSGVLVLLLQPVNANAVSRQADNRDFICCSLGVIS